ncbi:hypothetical protein JR316_0012941 [Psilocybe cubensis]|uniref:Uncharacterized protein n=2 Tax=Psilocybe cubensis TaxID=181762 RepID=A0ACB8GGH2_PSICU|nr:hypothetical protein JR316_0012941 [Psilocybe cubensis]KAH9474482.1 hypothetical protein JR316_0012941 [Psilocybe cubensis]
MSDSPPIVYAVLPDSPTEVQYSYNTHESISPIITPVRKKRVSGKVSRLAKKQRSTPITYSKSGEEFETETQTVLQDDTNELAPFYDEEYGVSAPEIDTLGESVNEGASRTDDEEYSYFLDAVLADECGFYQLTGNLFVANGWSNSRRESTVRETDQ